MLTILLCPLCIILLTTSYLVTCEDCPNGTSSTNLQFTKKMKISQLGIFKEYMSIDCCVVGFTHIEWSFDQSESGNWSNNIPGPYDFLQDKMKIYFTSLKMANQGFYRCEATNGTNVISGITKLVVGCPGIDTDLAIYNQSKKTNFVEHDTGELCCTTSSKDDLFPIVTKWSFKNSTDGNYSEVAIFFNTLPFEIMNKERYSIWRNYSTISNVCFVDTTVQTCISFPDILQDDSGYYKCHFYQYTKGPKFEFSLQVTPVVNYYKTYAISAAMVCVLVVGSLVGTWIFYYDIVMVYKKRFHPNAKSASTDVIIIYDDQDQSAISTALEIANILSASGLSSYIYDRDKRYGAETHQEYLSAMANCNIILFLTTVICVDNEMWIFCLQNSINMNGKTMFVFLSPRKAVLSTFHRNEETEHIRQIYQTIKVSRNHRTWKSNFAKDSFGRRRFVGWLLSNLPYKAVKLSKNRKDKEKLKLFICDSQGEIKRLS